MSRTDCRNLQELIDGVDGLSSGDRIVLLTDRGAFRFRLTTSSIQFQESDEKGNLKPDLCPDCGHPITTHLTNDQKAARNQYDPQCQMCCYNHRCPCTRTYESLVEETMKVTLPALPEGAEYWVTAQGQRIDSNALPESAKYEQIAGVRVEKQMEIQPSLSLIVVDFGQHCVIHIENEWWLEGERRPSLYPQVQEMLQGLRYQGATATNAPFVVSHPFAELRAAIDRPDVPPLPRLEVTRDDGEPVMYRLFAESDADDMPLKVFEYDALSTLAGKPLPIYEPTGEWEQIFDGSRSAALKKGLPDIWRYTQ